MKKIDSITTTKGRLLKAYENGLGTFVHKDVVKTVKTNVDTAKIRTGKVTKFYPYLNKAEVQLDNLNKKVISTILHHYGGELTDYYTPNGDEDFCKKLHEPCIIPRFELKCLVVKIHETDSQEYLLLGYLESDEIIGNNIAPKGNIRLSSVGATNEYYVQFGSQGLQIGSKEKPKVEIGDMEDETKELDYVFAEDVYNKEEIDNKLENYSDGSSDFNLENLDVDLGVELGTTGGLLTITVDLIKE